MDVDVPVVPISVVDNVPVAITGSPLARASAAADRRTLIALGFGTFVAALVFIIPPLFFPQMARDLQVSVPLLGQIMSAMLGLSVVLGLVIGPLSDRSGYRRLILVGLVAATICLFVFGLSPTFLLLLLASAAGAVTDAGVLGSSLAVAGTAFTGTAARRAIGWTSAAQAGSAVIGVPAWRRLGLSLVGGWRTSSRVSSRSPSWHWQDSGCPGMIASPRNRYDWTASWRLIAHCCGTASCDGSTGRQWWGQSAGTVS